MAVRSGLQVDLTPFLRAGRAQLESTLRLQLPPGDAVSLGRGVRLAAPAAVAVSLRGDACRVHVRVEARLALVHPCDRCLHPVSLQVDLSYAEEWRLPSGRGAAPLPEDDAAVVRRDVSEPVAGLDDGFWQNAAFALPTKVLCRPGCRGLCPRCGADRNRTPCACRDDEPDPRLAVLASWRASPKP